MISATGFSAAVGATIAPRPKARAEIMPSIRVLRILLLPCSIAAGFGEAGPPIPLDFGLVGFAARRGPRPSQRCRGEVDRPTGGRRRRRGMSGKSPWRIGQKFNRAKIATRAGDWQAGAATRPPAPAFKRSRAPPPCERRRARRGRNRRACRRRRAIGPRSSRDRRDARRTAPARRAARARRKTLARRA